MTTDDLEARLGATLGAPITAAQRRVLDARVTARLASAKTRTGSSARRRSLVAALVVLVLAASAVGASAAMRNTESPLGLASADEYAHELDAAKQVVPIPSGAAWPSYLAVSDWSASYSRGGGRSQVEFVAVCLWSDSWLEADRSGDPATRATAAAALRDVRTWEIYTGSAPIHGMRAQFDRLAEAASRGDPAPIQSFVALNCTP
jgi:hypothetical protein